MNNEQEIFVRKQNLIDNVISTNKKLDDLYINFLQNNNQLTINGKYYLFSLEDKPSEHEFSPNKQFGFKDNKYEIYITLKPFFQKVGPFVHIHKYQPEAYGKLMNDHCELKKIDIFQFISKNRTLEGFFKEMVSSEVYNNKNSNDITIKNIFNMLHKYVPICFEELNTIYKHEGILNEILNINGISFETI